MPGPAPRRRIADLGKRFLGSLIDGLAGMVFLGPGYAMMFAGGALADENNPGGAPEFTALALVGVAAVLLGLLALMGLQIYLLATRSQSIGKYLMKTQIVSYQTGQPAGFAQTFLLRGFVNGLITAIPCVGSVYALVDICFIFGEEHRCVHDLLAGTSVVDIS